MKLFLSYRRTDRTEHVDRLQQRLAEAFGESNVFFDETSIPAGADFRSVLRGQLMRVDCLLAVIGPNYSIERLSEPDDYVRFEVATALSMQVKVIPVLIDGAKIPAAEELPADVAQLAYRNAVRLRDDPEFDRDVDRLTQALDIIVDPDEDESSRTVVVGLPAPMPVGAPAPSLPPPSAPPGPSVPPSTAARTAANAGRSMSRVGRMALTGGALVVAAAGGFVVAKQTDSSGSATATQEPTTVPVVTVVGPPITAGSPSGTTPTGAYPVAFGDTISADQPPGAGHIETPGGRDNYELQVQAGQSLFLPIPQPKAQCKPTFVVLVMNPDGTVAGNNGNCSLDRRFDFEDAGTVQIQVTGNEPDWTGTYELTLGAVLGSSGAPDDKFSVQIGSSVGPDQPSGAGHLETSGSRDVYELEVQAGQSLFLPIPQPKAPCKPTFIVLVTNPDGTVAGNNGNCSLDRRFDFKDAGTVRIQVSGGEPDWTGTYSLDFLASGG